jgi:hypothetical protein
MLMKFAAFWGITGRRVVIVDRLGLLTRKDGPDTLSRNVGKQLRQRRVIPQKTAHFMPNFIYNHGFKTWHILHVVSHIVSAFS